MKTVKISLNSIDKVKSFVNTITRYDYDFDLVSGRYVIDSRPIDLNIHAEGLDESGTSDILEVLKPYIVE